MSQEREIRVATPICQNYQGGCGVAFLSFAALLPGLLLACLSPSKWAPTY